MRKLCSNDVRNRLNVVGWASGGTDAGTCVDGPIREDDADVGLASGRFGEIIKNGLLIGTLALDGAATAAMWTRKQVSYV